MAETASVEHEPDGRWKFDANVADCFDDMLARSIPQYEIMRRACFDLACKYAQPDTAIVDLGCSRGEAIAAIVDCLGAKNIFIGCEVSEPMLEACRQRFAGYIKCGMVDIRSLDLREKYPRAKASVTLAVLTLQFVPIEYRQRVVAECFKHTIKGGAFIVVEKILGSSADIDAAMVERYYDLKHENGYSNDSIERKRLSLEGVLVPVTAEWNEDLLRSAGFKHIDCFWRWMNFAGWLAVKE